METNKLTAQALRNVKPSETVQKLSDGGGLYLEIRPTGGKFWRFAFRWHGRQQTLTLGRYPDLPLGAARLAHAEARRLIASGVNPCTQKREEKIRQLHTVGSVAQGWLEHKRNQVSENRWRQLESYLNRYILPAFGTLPVAEVTGGAVLRWLRSMEADGIGPFAISLSRQILGMVLDEAVVLDLIQASPLASSALRRSVRTPKAEHLPSPTEPDAAGRALAALWKVTESGDAMSRLCRILPYLAVRPSEAASMRWEAIDLKAAEWRFVVSKTKQPHIVPLSRQAIALLGAPKAGGWVFPTATLPDKHIDSRRLPKVFKYGSGLDGILSPHGCRAMFRTLAAERLGYSGEILEIQLSHRVPGPLGDTYQRARFLEQRRHLMQEWADYIDGLRGAAENGSIF